MTDWVAKVLALAREQGISCSVVSGGTFQFRREGQFLAIRAPDDERGIAELLFALQRMGMEFPPEA